MTEEKRMFSALQQMVPKISFRGGKLRSVVFFAEKLPTF